MLKIWKYLSVEPVGSVAPKITKGPPSDDYHLNQDIAILCPAQAFPKPVYR